MTAEAALPQYGGKIGEGKTGKVKGKPKEQDMGGLEGKGEKGILRKGKKPERADKGGGGNARNGGPSARV